jgi:tripeptide aminopeptidase
MATTTPSTTRTSVLERFLRYVKIDTQSALQSETRPSTLKQLVLLDLLAEELRAIGLADAVRGEFGHVFATIPATTKKRVPVIGFVAHVDTSPDADGAGVKPIVHRGYDGRDIVLPDDPSMVLRESDIPALARQRGNDIVTASGTTLLGADDKAGVAEIMAAAEWLVQHPEIPHGPIRIAFTPDEEVGGGVTHFDVAAFGAFCAYTVDGEERGEVDTETFCGDSMNVTFQGFGTHPGFAKGRLINAIKIAADFITRLPKQRSPETTEGREGYLHPVGIDAEIDHTTVRFICATSRSAGCVTARR